MKHNLKITMKAIQMYEHLTKSPFNELEHNQGNMIALIYCCLLAHPENNFNMTFPDAMMKYFPNTGEDLVAELTTQMQFDSQFMGSLEDEKNKDDNSIKETPEGSPKEKEHMFLSSLIPMLVTDGGLDINYVMNDMPYYDIERFVQNIIKKRQEDLESQRFWTYLSMLPHVNTKKIKGPQDLIEFPWEKEAKKKKFETIDFKAATEKLKEFGIIKEKENE